MRRLIAAVVVTLAIAPAAAAANYPSPVLDAAASAVAGKPVTVWCEMDPSAWATMIPAGVSEVDGFTHVGGEPVLYLSPQVCMELHAILDRDNVGTFFAAQGIEALAHEAVHQRGITDEGETDCAALTQVVTVAERLGITATVRKSFIGYAKRLIAGRHVRVPVLKSRTLPNPFLTGLQVDARRWHEARPPAYQGSCG